MPLKTLQKMILFDVKGLKAQIMPLKTLQMKILFDAPPNVIMILKKVLWGGPDVRQDVEAFGMELDLKLSKT